MTAPVEVQSIVDCSSLGFVPSHYDLHLDLSDHTKRNFTGKATITFSRAESSGNHDKNAPLELVLSIDGIAVISASPVGLSDAKAVVRYDRPRQRVHLVFSEITLGALVEQDIRSVQVELNYIAKLTKINTYKENTSGVFTTNFLPENTDSPASSTVIATQSQPCDSRKIFPCADELSLKATFSLSLRLNPRFSAVSTSPLLSETLSEDEKSRVFVFEKTPPTVVSLFAFVCGDMEFIERTVQVRGNEISLRIFSLVGSLSKTLYAIGFTSFILPILAEKLGSLYPGSKLDIVALPFLLNGAVENSNLICIQQDILLVSPEELEASRAIGKCGSKLKQLNQIIVHELAHQWLGNLVSFLSWGAYWLNELLATFVAYCVLSDVSFDFEFSASGQNVNPDYGNVWKEQNALMEVTFLSDLDPDAVSIAADSEQVQNINVSSIHQTFNQHLYEKGIHLLRMLMNAFVDEKYDDASSPFMRRLGEFAEQYAHQVVKPIDFWLFFKGKSNLTDMIVSWTRLPGFPVIEVTIKEGKICLTQHRFVGGTKEEDYIYHVPLNIVKTDGSSCSLILKERSKVLDIDASSFLLISQGGFFKIDYRDLSLYENISQNLSNLPDRSLVKLLANLEGYTGTERSVPEIHGKGLVKIVNSITLKKQLCVSLESLEVVLRLLQFLGSSIQLYKTQSEYTHFKKYLNLFIKKTFELTKPHPTDFSGVSYTSSEITCLNMMLTLGVEVPEIIAYSQSLFKSLLLGPKNSVPREIVLAVLINNLYNLTSAKNFKKTLQLTTRTADIILPNINNHLASDLESPISISELQTAAVSSLGFVQDESLFQKVLNYIGTNIDSRAIELALAGFNYYDNNKPFGQNSRKKAVFNWFKVNFYNMWGLRSLREGSEYSKLIYETIHNIFEILAKNFSSDEDVAILTNFIKEMEKKDVLYKKHAFAQLLEDTQSSQHREKATVHQMNVKELFSL